MASSSIKRTRALALFMAIALHLLMLRSFVAPKSAAHQTGGEPRRSGSLILVKIPAAMRPPALPSLKLKLKRRAEKPDAATPPQAEAPAPKASEPADPFSLPLAPGPKAVSAATMIKLAKFDVAKIDKELRGKAPPLPAERPDSLQARLERGISDAFVGHADTTWDHYTSPDGVTYTRITRNGRSSCFMSGAVNFAPGILHNAASAKSVNCPPPNSGWVK